MTTQPTELRPIDGNGHVPDDPAPIPDAIRIAFETRAACRGCSTR